MIDEMARVRAVRPEIMAGEAPPLEWAELRESSPAGALAPIRTNEIPRRSPHLRHRAWIAASAAALIVIAAVFIQRSLREPAAAGPSPATSSTAQSAAAPSSLETLALAAEQQPLPGTGDVRYVSVQVWEPDSPPDPALRTGTERTWKAPDLSGRVESSVSQYGWHNTPGDYAAGMMMEAPECQTGDVTIYPPDDPTEPPAYARLGWILTCNTLDGPIPGSAQANLIRQLAAAGGFQEKGMVTDWLGRQGLGFAVTHTFEWGTQERMIILDPTTGGLLAQQTMIVGDSEVYDKPTLVEYVALVESAMVPAIGDRP